MCRQAGFFILLKRNDFAQKRLIVDGHMLLHAFGIDLQYLAVGDSTAIVCRVLEFARQLR